MTPFEYAAVGVALAGTATSAYVGVSQANSAAKDATRTAQIQLEQYEAEKKAAATQADQEQAAIEAARARAISASAALRAGRGLDVFSATGRQLLTDLNEEADADLETSKANAGGIQRRNVLEAQASAIRTRSDIATARAGGIGAVAGAVGSAARLASSYAPSSKNGGKKYLSSAED